MGEANDKGKTHQGASLADQQTLVFIENALKVNAVCMGIKLVPVSLLPRGSFCIRKPNRHFFADRKQEKNEKNGDLVRSPALFIQNNTWAAAIPKQHQLATVLGNS